MNQTQRTYLIDTIRKKTKDRVEAMEGEKVEGPNLANYLFKHIMAGTLEIKSTEELLATLKAKAIKARPGDTWYAGDRYSSEREVKFQVKEFFVLPPDYLELQTEAREKNERITQEVTAIKMQMDTLITRIQLASNSTLEGMIQEVDDMGNLSLMDLKLRPALGSAEAKLLGE